MSNRLMVNNNNPIKRPGQVQGPKKTNKTKKDKSSPKTSFKDVLARKIQQKEGVKFSKHAQSRLQSREINLSEEDLTRLENGVKKAAAKGAKDSLIMVNNVAYVVSVKNKTVITAVDDSSMQEKVFTNIDSAVFMG